ncbi:hypothetical protein [Streptomyces sp. NPDC090025]|uniref:hypothetical protein n=1 Tax=Streptomyces sp. NPDC090025 TaxID=3365922 RepID=UPI00383253DC
MNRNEDDDLRTLRRMLPVPEARDFPAGRRTQREDHLMTSLLSQSHQDETVRRRRRRGVRIAVPAGIAAAAGAVALTLLPAGTAAAYTVEQVKDGGVKLTIAQPDAKLDINALEQDMAKAGVHVQVYTGDPKCTVPWENFPGPKSGKPPLGTPTVPPGAKNLPNPPAPPALPKGSVPTEDPATMATRLAKENGKTVLFIKPDKIPRGRSIIIGFPNAERGKPGSFDVIKPVVPKGPIPPCLPAGLPEPPHPPTPPAPAAKK